MYLCPNMWISTGFGIISIFSRASIATGYASGIVIKMLRRISLHKDSRDLCSNSSSLIKAIQEVPRIAGGQYRHGLRSAVPATHDNVSHGRSVDLTWLST